MRRKGSEISPSKRYPLRSTHSNGRFLRSATNKSNATSSGPLNDSAPAHPATRRRKSGSSSGSPSNTVRVLRSASKNKVDLSSESQNDSIPSELEANKRKCIRPSKATSPINSVRVLRSASKNQDKACDETLNSSTAGKQVADERKWVTPSKVESPNNSVRVLRSASKNKNEAYCEPLNDNTIVQQSVKKRKSVSPLKVGSTASSARLLRSNSKRTNETFNEPQHDSPAIQQASRKGNSDTPTKGGSPKLGGRVLRSSSEKKDACVEALRASIVLALPSTHHVRQQRLNVSTPVKPVVKRRKSGGSSQECSPKNDYLKIRQRVRYVLKRMNYEQSLIQAYAGEGWKGQSSEKIRPEKELERAKAEILRCKIKIREAFQNMDSLLSEGKLEESLFDSAGQIFSEDIFCSICGSKDVTLKNDIILCDGACDRGFHQNCLNPPLQTEDIPPGNEGWFCPACMCKIDCIDALNELQGSKLSVHDSWERVFPEAASLANGAKKRDASDLPLDDSEDNCYNPALDKVHIVKGHRSSAHNDVDDLGLPSDDSEDDDFDPAGPDSSEHQKGESHSEESDFTSDSDDFCAEIAKSCRQGGISPLCNVNEEFHNHIVMETELDQDVVLPVSSRRQVERLDYKKLYDEAYGEESSSSSDDEEWSGKDKLEDSETDGSVRPAKQRSRRASIKHPNSQHTPQSERRYGSVTEQQAEIHRSNGSNGSARHFSPTIRQKLNDHFENDPYPSHAMKENLALELGLTFIQVDKWFANTRHSSRVAAAKKGKHTENHTTGNDGTPVDSAEVNDEVLVELTADRNGMTHEEMTVQHNPNEGNKKDIPLSRTETETDADATEASSDDKEWSGTSISQKELEDTETDSHAAFNHGKRLTRRALVEPLNIKHTPLSEQLHVSVNDQQTEAPYFNGSSSKARKYHFGPIIKQKLKVHFEKDPYPNRSTIQSLAQELGLTFIQVRKWFASTRHYSSVSAAKKGKGPGNQTKEKNDNTTLDSVRPKESDNGVMENLTKDRNDSLSQKLMLQINLNEGNNGDIMFSQHPSHEEALATTPTAISIEVGPPGYMPGENQGNGAVWSTGFEEGLTTTPTPVSREVGPQGYGYGPGESQGYSESWNIIPEQRVLMTPNTTMSIPQEVCATGYGPGENQGNNASWNTNSEQRLFMNPTTSTREACPPGYGPGEGQVNTASWNTCFDQWVDAAPSTISRQVSPPGYGPRENHVSGASWNTSTEQRSVMTPSTIPREVDPPGYWPGENQGNSASWNNRREQNLFMTPTTTLSEVGPPGYGPGENKGNGASSNIGSPNGRSSEKQELADEARKKAIARELRRMKKFR